MATIKLQNGKVISKNGKASCTCCDPIGPCISGSNDAPGTGNNQNGPCVDFVTATTTAATMDGLYVCTGGVDDQANITWSGGSFFSPANQPNVGPCYGAHNFSFNANLQKGDTVTCNAGSWGGPVGCSINCCPISTI